MAAPTLPPGGTALRDIHGIAGAPWWPPAPGWWLLAAALLLLALALRLRGPAAHRWGPVPTLTLGSWRRAAAQELRALRRRRPAQPARATAGELSQLLRRIAMARLGRTACAGLTGEDWLRWLAANDPHGFDWVGRGRLLLAAPYAPPGAAAGEPDATTLGALIDATAAWVEARPARAARAAGASSRAGASSGV